MPERRNVSLRGVSIFIAFPTATNQYGLQQEGICYEKRRQDAFSCLAGLGSASRSNRWLSSIDTGNSADNTVTSVDTVRDFYRF
jgi:hypothetical protein